jgi:hypothetical protein
VSLFVSGCSSDRSPSGPDSAGVDLSILSAAPLGPPQPVPPVPGLHPVLKVVTRNCNCRAIVENQISSTPTRCWVPNRTGSCLQWSAFFLQGQSSDGQRAGQRWGDAAQQGLMLQFIGDQGQEQDQHGHVLVVLCTSPRQ